MDARHNLNRLLIFISSIVIGIAALVSINSFNFALQEDIDSQATELLGADMSISSRNKYFDSLFLRTIDSLKAETAGDARFASMVFFPKNEGTRLIQVVAIEGRYPFYGSVLLTDSSDIAEFHNGKSVMIDEVLAIQYDIRVGDSLKLGRGTFPICALVRQFPGNTSIGATFAPSVYVPYNLLDRTGLIQYGSRINYHKYLFLKDRDIDKIESVLRPLARQNRYGIDTVEERKEELGASFQNLYRFLNLLGFIALILGGIGVSSSVHIYLREKRESVAILRCLGASGWQVFYVFFIQINILGLIGTTIGIAVGIFVQYLLPQIVSDFLPVSVEFRISYVAVVEGFLVGFIMSVLFAALPLSDIRLVSPLEIFRSEVEPMKKVSKFRYMIIVLVILFPWLFAINQTGSLLYGSIFIGALLLTFICLFLAGIFILWIARKSISDKLGFVFHQGMANLFRPGNQTIILIVVIGLGTFILCTLSLIQNSLLGQVEFAGSGKRPNTVLFDIQPYQKDELVDFTRARNIPVQQVVPIVTMRLKSLKDKSVEEWQKDTTESISRWALNHEYRVTYRDSLIESESLNEGKLRVPVNDTIYISVSDGLAEDLNLKLGDQLEFNVQGVPLKTYVGSIRKVDWQRIQTNFMVVFPSRVLEQAPQFFVLITRIDTREKSAEFQQSLVKKFPNVSAIDLTLILATLDQIFDKVELVIRFMAIFSVLTGLFVLTGAIANSKYARLRENILLRTIGALQKQLIGMTLVEYFLLGTLAVISGCLLAIASSWALVRFFFEIKFNPEYVQLMFICLVIIILSTGVGWINTRSILSKSPLEVLRKEI
ncbi:MAG TPA: FtsX-like permease family protein [Cyclobacteriaceae bacterium]|nr:FtsX-like permease family protein [Cyclobacteriaceae bacterium]